MSSFEETLFKAMLPMFERALHSAANEAVSPVATAPAPSAPVLAAPAVTLEIPKAA
jgi:hypothetical protein